MSGIPISLKVSATPSVLSAGGSGSDLIGLVLTTNTLVPTSTIKSFSTAAGVGAYFGLSSDEYSYATVYFAGFSIGTKTPATIKFAQYNESSVSAKLIGGSLGTMTLAQLKAITGTVSVTVDGTVKSGTVTLSAVTSFSGAAAAIATALSVTCTYDSIANCFIIASGTTGASSTITYATTTTAATSLMLTAAAGAQTSQGAAAAVPASFMASIVNIDTGWATFATVFNPDSSGFEVKEAFAAWVAVNPKYAYICWDSETAGAVADPATSSLGYALQQSGNSGTCLIYTTDPDDAAFVQGTAASINFEATNGRITFDGKTQSGRAAMVTDATSYSNLIANGYNFFAQFEDDSIIFVNGSVTGDYLWLDSYLNQIWQDKYFQSSLFTLMKNVNSIPYGTPGYTLQRAALQDPIDAGLNFGMFGPSTISNAQAAAVDNAAGLTISTTLQTRGYYLQVLPATAAARAARTTNPMNFWFIDRGSIQQMNIASIELQ